MRGVAIVVAGVLAGCGVKDSSSVEVKLEPAKLVIAQKDGTQHVLAVDGHGALTWDTNPIGRLSADGRVYLGSRQVLRLQKGGKTIAQGRVSNVVVRTDGGLEVDGRQELTIADDGAVTGPLIDEVAHPRFDPAGGTIRYEG